MFGLAVEFTSRIQLWITMLVGGGYLAASLLNLWRKNGTEQESDTRSRRLLLAQAFILSAVLLDIFMIPDPLAKRVGNWVWNFFWPPFFASIAATFASALVAYMVKGSAKTWIRVVTTILVIASLIGLVGFWIDFPADWRS
jgi:hypothetical protein